MEAGPEGTLGLTRLANGPNNTDVRNNNAKVFVTNVLSGEHPGIVRLTGLMSQMRHLTPPVELYSALWSTEPSDDPNLNALRTISRRWLSGKDIKDNELRFFRLSLQQDGPIDAGAWDLSHGARASYLAPESAGVEFLAGEYETRQAGSLPIIMEAFIHAFLDRVYYFLCRTPGGAHDEILPYYDSPPPFEIPYSKRVTPILKAIFNWPQKVVALAASIPQPVQQIGPASTDEHINNALLQGLKTSVSKTNLEEVKTNLIHLALVVRCLLLPAVPEEKRLFDRVRTHQTSRELFDDVDKEMKFTTMKDGDFLRPLWLAVAMSILALLHQSFAKATGAYRVSGITMAQALTHPQPLCAGAPYRANAERHLWDWVMTATRSTACPRAGLDKLIRKLAKDLEGAPADVVAFYKDPPHLPSDLVHPPYNTIPTEGENDKEWGQFENIMWMLVNRQPCLERSKEMDLWFVSVRLIQGSLYARAPNGAGRLLGDPTRPFPQKWQVSARAITGDGEPPSSSGLSQATLAEEPSASLLSKQAGPSASSRVGDGDLELPMELSDDDGMRLNKQPQQEVVPAAVLAREASPAGSRIELPAATTELQPRGAQHSATSPTFGPNDNANASQAEGSTGGKAVGEDGREGDREDGSGGDGPEEGRVTPPIPTGGRQRRSSEASATMSVEPASSGERTEPPKKTASSLAANAPRTGGKTLPRKSPRHSGKTLAGKSPKQSGKSPAGKSPQMYGKLPVVQGKNTKKTGSGDKRKRGPKSNPRMTDGDSSGAEGDDEEETKPPAKRSRTLLPIKQELIEHTPASILQTYGPQLRQNSMVPIPFQRHKRAVEEGANKKRRDLMTGIVILPAYKVSTTPHPQNGPPILGWKQCQAIVPYYRNMKDLFEQAVEIVLRTVDLEVDPVTWREANGLPETAMPDLAWEVVPLHPSKLLDPAAWGGVVTTLSKQFSHNSFLVSDPGATIPPVLPALRNFSRQTVAGIIPLHNPLDALNYATLLDPKAEDNHQRAQSAFLNELFDEIDKRTDAAKSGTLDRTPTAVMNFLEISVVHYKRINLPAIPFETNPLPIIMPDYTLRSEAHLPNSEKWAIVSMAGSYSNPHIDAAGVATLLCCVQGSKTFSVSLGPPLFDENGQLDYERIRWQRVEMEKNDFFYLRPGVLHNAETNEESMIIGSHFYSPWTMDQTFYALLLQHHHTNITNDEQSEFLFKLFMQVLEFKNECVDHNTPDRFCDLYRRNTTTLEDKDDGERRFFWLILTVLYLDQLAPRAVRKNRKLCWQETKVFGGDLTIIRLQIKKLLEFVFEYYAFEWENMRWVELRMYAAFAKVWEESERVPQEEQAPFTPNVRVKRRGYSHKYKPSAKANDDSVDRGFDRFANYRPFAHKLPLADWTKIGRNERTAWAKLSREVADVVWEPTDPFGSTLDLEVSKTPEDCQTDDEAPKDDELTEPEDEPGVPAEEEQPQEEEEEEEEEGEEQSQQQEEDEEEDEDEEDEEDDDGQGVEESGKGQSDDEDQHSSQLTSPDSSDAPDSSDSSDSDAPADPKKPKKPRRSRRLRKADAEKARSA